MPCCLFLAIVPFSSLLILAVQPYAACLRQAGTESLIESEIPQATGCNLTFKHFITLWMVSHRG